MRSWIAVFFFTVSMTSAWACGTDSDCALGNRSYRIHVPEHRRAEPMGAIFFAHGFRGSAGGTMRNKSLLRLADELGVALVAAQSVGTGWLIPGRPRQKDNTGAEEYAYFEKLIDDVSKRFGVDRRKIMATGFSSGGMMIWELACNRGNLFIGFAPVSGTFWAPVPKKCPSPPVNLMHFHGLSDGVVPIAGRVIADSSQGDVRQALALFVEGGRFGPPKPMPARGLKCMRHENAERKILEFCTHPAGHSIKTEFIKRAWLEFQKHSS